MLPVRLGMLNARGPQDLVLYVLTRNGRVETTNYRTVKLPANMDLPVYVRGEFARSTRRSSTRRPTREDYRVVFTEYFWDMSWCDPCAADPLSPDELRAGRRRSGPATPRRRGGGAAGDAHAPAPALHARHAAGGPGVPGDAGPQNFQARYVLRHPWTGDARRLRRREALLRRGQARQEREAQTLASLTGWQLDAIRARMALRAAAAARGGSRCGNEHARPSNCAHALAIAATSASCPAWLPRMRASSRSRSSRRCCRSACWCATSRCACADGAGVRGRARDAGVLAPRDWTRAARRAVGARHLLRPVDPAARRLAVGASAGRGARDLRQVRDARPRQAPVQPGEPRRDPRDHAAARHVDLAGAMGQRSRARRVVRRARRRRASSARSARTSPGCSWAPTSG